MQWMGDRNPPGAHVTPNPIVAGPQRRMSALPTTPVISDYYSKLSKDVVSVSSAPLSSPQIAPSHRKTPSRSSSFGQLPSSPFYNNAINLTGMSGQITTSSTVHPGLGSLQEVDSYIRDDPSCLVQILPDIFHAIERHVALNPGSCLPLWNILKPILDMVAPQGQSGKPHPTPPSPECEPKEQSTVNSHGHIWADEYLWLKDRENPDVLKYIDEENRYADAVMTHAKPLQRLLYKEFVSRLDEGGESTKVTMGDGWTYYSRKVAGLEYQQHVRCMDEGVEDVYLDENELTSSPEFEDASYFTLGFIRHSPDCRTVAYGVDTKGNERYSTYFLRLADHKVLPERIDEVYEFLEWSNDGDFVFYLLLDDCERAYKLMRHELGTDPASDALLYHEHDESFYLSLTKSCNSKFIILNSAAQVTSETRYIPADSSLAQPRLLIPRRENTNYVVESHENHLYILTNEDSKNNWIYRIPVPETLNPPLADNDWENLLELRETVIEHRDFVLIEDFILRENHLIVFERSNCLQNVRIVDLRQGFTTYHYISFSDSVYSLWPGTVNEEIGSLSNQSLYHTNVLRFTFSSFVTPRQVIDYNMDTREMTVVHEETVNGLIPYDPSLYVQQRLYATGVDGTTIPLSIVYRRDLLGLAEGIPNPCLLHSYGAYGSSMNPIFSHVRLSLLDRGFIFAIAHVRGGADMGNGWYEEGKLGKKPNTFLDFISCAEYLCKEGYTSPSKLAIYGRSAGGLLIGAVITMRPDLFKAALTEVPFLDVVNTMFNPNIPWTAYEYEEWGNPVDANIYECMRSYCPYTQLKRLGNTMAKGEFPDLLVIGGMNDPRVAFFEPLKFIARMRNERRQAKAALVDSGIKLEDRMILLKVQDAGHGGSSGQYSYLEDLAYEYAFLIDRLEASFRPIPPGHGLNMNTAYSYYGPGWLFGDLEEDMAADESSDVLQDKQYSPELGSPLKSVDRKSREAAHLHKLTVEEKEYRSSKKGDRRQNKLYQWMANFF